MQAVYVSQLLTYLLVIETALTSKILCENVGENLSQKIEFKPSTALLHQSEEHVSMNLSVILDEILENYDNRLRPNFYGPQVRVEVGLIIKGISSVSEVSMELETDFYFHQSWEDPRLAFRDNRPLRPVILSHGENERIWQPDTYFPNEKESHIHSATTENEFFRWLPDGTIIKSTRLTLKSTCLMSLEHFPMDRQICGIEFGSYGLSDADIIYTWKASDSILMGSNAGKLLPQFTVLGYRRANKTVLYALGNFTYLYCEFMFARSTNYYLVEVYIPSMLIVVISWLPFWMGTLAGPERMGLGLTSMLTITTLLLSAHSNSPKISYVKALDIYGGFCYAMVFASLLHSAVMCYIVTNASVPLMLNIVERGLVGPEGLPISRSADQTNPKITKTWRPLRSAWALNINRSTLSTYSNPMLLKRREPGDTIAKVIFPTLFIAFNCIYWGYYLNASQHRLEGDWIQLHY